ncbi:MAG: YkvA family protein [Bacillus sp. (in: firmicutes)]
MSKEFNEEIFENELEKSGKYYSEDKMWDKLKRLGKKAGTNVVYTVLLLYFTLQKPDIPAKTKAIIVGALGYFILPLDLLPDIAVGLGYTDDLGVLGIALLQIAFYIDEEVKTKAKAKLNDWFGEGIDTAEIDQKI